MIQMVEFSTAMLGALSAFLCSEPIIYVFTLVMICFLCKIIKILASP